MSELQLTPYQQALIEQGAIALGRIAAASERFVQIVEIAASGWLNACPPRGDYRPDINANVRCPGDPMPEEDPRT